ncbi:MAG: DUF4292 domain-containing protein [Myxococcota bacterium]|nr:DUF4292 domain-containing protein [Myxococcota bacterium]
MEKNPKLTIFSVLIIMGCGGFPKPRNALNEPGPLLTSIDRRDAALRSLTAELDVEIWQRGERVKLRQYLAADDQGRLRIEVISPFGNPLMTLASDGSRLMIFDSKEGRFFLGPVTQTALSRLLPVPMSPPELASLLRGAIPRIRAEQTKLHWDSKTGRYRVHLTSEALMQMIHFEPEYYRVTRLETRLNGRVLYKVRMGDYSGTGDDVIPRRVRFEVPDEDLSIDMTIKDSSLNPRLASEVFTLSPPRGIVVEPIP